jgi:glycosyltransferase involved in cell wall biosynthesis
MRVSFVIPALNEERHLPACLRSVAALDRPPGVEVEVIVVDNKSTDRTPELARAAGAEVLTVDPGRVSRARNAGTQASAGDLLGFIDADCELSPDWLTRCVGHLANPKVLAVGTRMAPPAPGAPWVETTWFALAHGQPASDVERVEWLASFNLLVRREAFEAVGGFDEALITCEDSDLGYKLSARGALVRDHVARTAHHGESKTLRQFFRREAWRARGNLPSLLKRKLVLGELPSLVLPPAFALAWVVGAALLIAGLLSLGVLAWVGAALLAGAALLPVAALLRKGILPTRPSLFARGWVLMTVYLFARAVGTVMPLGRVAR